MRSSGLIDRTESIEEEINGLFEQFRLYLLAEATRLSKSVHLYQASDYKEPLLQKLAVIVKKDTCLSNYKALCSVFDNIASGFNIVAADV